MQSATLGVYGSAVRVEVRQKVHGDTPIATVEMESSLDGRTVGHLAINTTHPEFLEELARAVMEAREELLREIVQRGQVAA